MPRVYDFKPSPHSREDRLYRESYVVPTSWPSFVDLRRLCSPVRDQGELGGCTGFALATGLREFLEIKLWGRRTQLSPLWLYYQERLLEGDVGEDAGANLADGMKVLATEGCAPEVSDPYLPQDFADPPSPVANKEAAAYRVLDYHRLLSLGDVKSSLARGFGVVMGFLVFASFETELVARTGKVPVPRPDEQFLGGHATFIVGYHQDPSWAGGGYLIVKNSWGTTWGDRGYFYLPYAYLEDPSLVTDLWVSTKTLPEAPPELGSWVPVFFGEKPLDVAARRSGGIIYLPTLELAHRQGLAVREDGSGLYLNGLASPPSADLEEVVPTPPTAAAVTIYVNGRPQESHGWLLDGQVLVPAPAWAAWTGNRLSWNAKAAAVMVEPAKS